MVALMTPDWLLQRSIPRPAILPSILAADFARLADDCSNASRLVGHPVLHVDVMDGHLVPNISLGVPVLASLRRAMPEAFFDVHLMIDEPGRYAGDFAAAGADLITFHIEAAPDARHIIKTIRDSGKRVGITLKPGTPVERILPFVPEVDLVLVMSVEPGFGGQKFMTDQLEKCRRISPILRGDQVLEIDGGIGPGTIRQAFDAGVRWFVVGSALFGAADRAGAATQMLGSLK